MDDFRKILYGVIIGFIAIIVGWVSFLTFSGCGYALNNCNGALPKVQRTSIPTLIPATLPAQVRFLPSTPTATSATAAPTEAGASEIARPSKSGRAGSCAQFDGGSEFGCPNLCGELPNLSCGSRQGRKPESRFR